MADPPKKKSLPPMSRISRNLAETGLRLKKGLGQNFLVNQNALRAIAEKTRAGEESLVLEIGCGLGNLSEMLAQRAARVDSVELDERFQAIHHRELGPYPNLHVHYKDFMDWDIRAYREEMANFPDFRVVGNIPYHLTSPILFKLLETPVEYDGVYLLMQREVARRLAARPGEGGYGILAVKISVRFQARMLMQISPGSFRPPPKVHSALVELVPRESGPLLSDAEKRDCFFRFVDAAFAQRRKMLPKGLAAAGIPRDKVEAALAEREISPQCRAEALSPQQFLQLFEDLGAPTLPALRKRYG